MFNRDLCSIEISFSLLFTALQGAQKHLLSSPLSIVICKGDTLYDYNAILCIRRSRIGIRVGHYLPAYKESPSDDIESGFCFSPSHKPACICSQSTGRIGLQTNYTGGIVEGKLKAILPVI